MKQVLSLIVMLFILQIAGAQWPLYADLNKGDVYHFERTINGQIKKFQLILDSFSHEWSPNLWHKIPADSGKQTLKEAHVWIRLNREKIELIQRPYQLPVAYQGLRLYVENTKTWAEKANFQVIKNLPKQVRISIAVDGETWGPSAMRFPIIDYRWRSGVYNNSWSSVVPYNSLYYHRGEDFGAIPDKLNVQAVLDGTISATLLPEGDGLSNAIVVKHDPQFSFRYAHMNTVNVNPRMLIGEKVKRGEVMAKTGDTYRKPGAQFRDPHLHVNFIVGDQAVSTYPYLVEAYLRDYPDTVLAVAGGYAFTLPGEPVLLDATRSIIRPGHFIKSYTWKLSDGSIKDSAKINMRYNTPGLYTEELIVLTSDGAEDRDYLQVRVYDKNNTKDISYGWAYHSPVRGIKSGTPVLFWNRLVQTEGEVMIDFGDGSPPQPVGREITYAYSKPGIYTVSFAAKGKMSDPAVIKMKVVVEGNNNQ